MTLCLVDVTRCALAFVFTYSSDFIVQSDLIRFLAKLYKTMSYWPRSKEINNLTSVAFPSLSWGLLGKATGVALSMNYKVVRAANISIVKHSVFHLKIASCEYYSLF